jgi:heterodisulfide reductase subunit A
MDRRLGMSDEPRIGVLLCSYTPQMKERLDFEEISEHASSIDSVVHVEKHPAWCLAPGHVRLREIIEEHQVDRVVVAGCSYRTHKHIFSKALEKAGLNAYLFEIVNLKDQCASVHTEGATERARDQIEMAVVRTATLLPLEEIKVPAEQKALVIGGGLSGLIAAGTLAASGCEVTIVEREEELGGYFGRNRSWRIRKNGEEAMPGIIAGVESDPNIEKLVSSRVIDVKGKPGAFDITIETPGGERQVRSGAIVVATGSETAPTGGAFGHDGDSVKTQEEFDQILYADTAVEAPLSIVMIQCIGSRNDERPYCSRACCLDAVRNATAARKKWPDSDVTILFRDLEMGCLTERDIKHALDAGVAFHRFDRAAPPEVEGGKVRLFDTMTGREVSILHDLIVLSPGETSHEGSRETAELLNIATDIYGFIPEPAVRLKPHESAGRGIYVTGAAHWPVSPEEAMYQAFEMASRAATDLKKGGFTTRPIVASVDESLCIGCHLCESMCAWGAIRVSAPSEGNKASVQSIICKGCGTCVASCPVMAIRAAYYDDEQILPSIKAAVTS